MGSMKLPEFEVIGGGIWTLLHRIVWLSVQREVPIEILLTADDNNKFYNPHRHP